MQSRVSGLPKGKMYAALCVPLMSVLIATSLVGQEGLSSLRGTISDKSGAVVAGAAVSAREVLTNIVARSVTSDGETCLTRLMDWWPRKSVGSAGASSSRRATVTW